MISVQDHIPAVFLAIRRCRFPLESTQTLALSNRFGPGPTGLPLVFTCHVTPFQTTLSGEPGLPAASATVETARRSAALETRRKAVRMGPRSDWGGVYVVAG